MLLAVKTVPHQEDGAPERLNREVELAPVQAPGLRKQVWRAQNLISDDKYPDNDSPPDYLERKAHPLQVLWNDGPTATLRTVIPTAVGLTPLADGREQEPAE